MKIYQTASHSQSNHSTPWLVSKNGFIDNSCNVLLSWPMWRLRWWCCCCCSGLKILRSCSWNQVRWGWNRFHLRRNRFSFHCCRKTEALTPVWVKCLEMRNQVMNKPFIWRRGEGSTGGTESLVLSNPELSAKISHLHFYKASCQHQPWELGAGAGELIPQAS